MGKETPKKEMDDIFMTSHMTISSASTILLKNHYQTLY